MFLVVYVDDFKIAGLAKTMKQAWGLVRQGLRMEAPVSLGKYLGCNHVYGAAVLQGGSTPPSRGG